MKTTLLASCIAVMALSTLGSMNPGDNLQYVQYDTDLISPATYKARRDSVMKLIGNDAVALFYSAPERTRNADVEYRYRQADNFYYLTGFTEPNSILMMSAKGIRVKEKDSTVVVKEILFVQPRSPHAETWTGRRYGVEGAVKLLGMEYAASNDKFKTIFSPGL